MITVRHPLHEGARGAGDAGPERCNHRGLCREQDRQQGRGGCAQQLGSLFPPLLYPLSVLSVETRMSSGHYYMSTVKETGLASN